MACPLLNKRYTQAWSLLVTGALVFTAIDTNGRAGRVGTWSFPVVVATLYAVVERTAVKKKTFRRRLCLHLNSE